MIHVRNPAFEVYVQTRRAAGQPIMLDVACGFRKVPGAFGVDAAALPGVDLVHNLNELPYPFPEHCADEIHLNHVLEHFDNPLPIMEEVWRLARPNGKVAIRTPHYSGIYAWRDPTHRRCFSAESLDRKSTRLNSSHANNSYAVFCLKKKHQPDQDCY